LSIVRYVVQVGPAREQELRRASAGEGLMAVRRIGFHVTDRCQLDCDHCIRDPNQAPKDLAFPVLQRAVEQARSLFGIEHVVFTGGEPTLYPHFLSAVDVAVRSDMTWHMVSNGKGFAKALASLRSAPGRVERMARVTLSLDGADAATHDSIRGEGSFREVMSACTLAVASGISVTLQTALHARNVHQVESLGLLASQLGASQVSFALTQPTGTPLDRDLYLSPRQWRATMDRIDRLAAALRLPVTTAEGFYRSAAFHTCPAFAHEELHVTVDGVLNLCCMHSGSPAGAKTDAAGPLASVPLEEAFAKLLDIVHREKQLRLEALVQGNVDSEWDHFACNWCLKSFGKPHWTEHGAAGAVARRERWNHGAFGKRRLQLIGGA
jgi:MoaA/NifB/PqqE/SkfB family radical SAM enzyme